MDLTMATDKNPQVLLELIRRLFLEINTAIPGEIKYFDSVTQTATVKPCIRSTTIQQDGSTIHADLPDIFVCPVWFPFSTVSGFSLTYPINIGDQCLIVFSQRSFDNWLKYGSVQNAAELYQPRTHAYTDAICLVGLIPEVNKIPFFQMNGIEMRNKRRNSYNKVTDTTQEYRIFDDTKDPVAECSEIRDILGTIVRHNTGSTTENTDVAISQTTPQFTGNYATSHTTTIGTKQETVTGDKTVTVKGNDNKTVDGNVTENVSGNRTITAPLITHKGETDLEGTIKTSPSPGGPLDVGQTVTVGIPGVATLRFVNGLLVQVS